jgi:MOSC domain-containing protein YiiM
MRVISVNAGTPVALGISKGREVLSAIVKKSVHGHVMVRRLGLEGDSQADLSVHGGENKAVYAYPSEHYDYWKERFPGMEMPWGTFGENMSVEGLLESEVHVGDSFAIGTTEFGVTQPRLPCYKLGMRFGTNAMLRMFLESERTGFYLKVIREGQVRAGDAIRAVYVNPGSETIVDVVRGVKKRQEKA